ncbi:MAG: carboxysome peptide B [Sulfuriferula sp.]
MDIMRVKDDLVCTRRVEGLQLAPLRVLENQSGGLLIATDPVGVPIGKWVFTASGSAARWAMPGGSVMTDLTICGIIDNWDIQD